jgi:hypothetical protein
MAPVTERRGHQSWGRWRLQGPQCWRHTVVEWAAESTRHAFWARAYDQPQRDKDASHQAAVRALAFTWMRMRFRCWQHRTRDAAAISLTALKRRGTPRRHSLAWYCAFDLSLVIAYACRTI